MKEDLESLSKVLHEVDEHVTSEDVYWAYTVVHSRDIGVYLEDNTYASMCSLDHFL